MTPILGELYAHLAAKVNKNLRLNTRLRARPCTRDACVGSSAPRIRVVLRSPSFTPALTVATPAPWSRTCIFVSTPRCTRLQGSRSIEFSMPLLRKHMQKRFFVIVGGARTKSVSISSLPIPCQSSILTLMGSMLSRVPGAACCPGRCCFSFFAVLLSQSDICESLGRAVSSCLDRQSARVQTKTAPGKDPK